MALADRPQADEQLSLQENPRGATQSTSPKCSCLRAPAEGHVQCRGWGWRASLGIVAAKPRKDPHVPTAQMRSPVPSRGHSADMWGAELKTGLRYVKLRSRPRAQMPPRARGPHTRPARRRSAPRLPRHCPTGATTPAPVTVIMTTTHQDSALLAPQTPRSALYQQSTQTPEGYVLLLPL